MAGRLARRRQNPQPDYQWYFDSTSPYSIPMEMQTFSFTTGSALDDDDELVEITVQGQIAVD